MKEVVVSRYTNYQGLLPKRVYPRLNNCSSKNSSCSSRIRVRNSIQILIKMLEILTIPREVKLAMQVEEVVVLDNLIFQKSI